LQHGCKPNPHRSHGPAHFFATASACALFANPKEANAIPAKPTLNLFSA